MQLDTSLVYSSEEESDWSERTYRITNPGSSWAFFIHLRLHDEEGSVIAPILWSVNMFSLLAEESRLVTVRFPSEFGSNLSLSWECNNNLGIHS